MHIRLKQFRIGRGELPTRHGEDVERERADGGADHGLGVAEELDGFTVQGEAGRLPVRVEEELNRALVELHRHRLEEGDVVRQQLLVAARTARVFSGRQTLKANDIRGERWDEVSFAFGPVILT